MSRIMATILTSPILIEMHATCATHNYRLFIGFFFFYYFNSFARIQWNWPNVQHLHDANSINVPVSKCEEKIKSLPCLCRDYAKTMPTIVQCSRWIRAGNKQFKWRKKKTKNGTRTYAFKAKMDFVWLYCRCRLSFSLSFIIETKMRVDAVRVQ